MKCNAVIKSIASCHPDKVLDNDYYLKYYAEKGQDISGLLRTLGREKRYVLDEGESIFDLCIKAANKALDNAYVKANDLDLIVFSSGSFEYLYPSNAAAIHEKLHASSKCCVYDVSAACCGMLSSFDQVSRIMQTNPRIRYALLIGAEQFSRFSNSNNPLTFASLGDSACAVVLESVVDTDRGLVDTDYYTNSARYDNVKFPRGGMYNLITNRNVNYDDRRIEWIDFDFSGLFGSAQISIYNLLFRNDLKKKNVKRYFVSQFALSNIKGICEDLGEDFSKFTYVGDEFGYTGVSSPFLAFERALQKNEVDRGDYVILWTIGVGVFCIGLLYKC